MLNAWRVHYCLRHCELDRAFYLRSSIKVGQNLVPLSWFLLSQYILTKHRKLPKANIPHSPLTHSSGEHNTEKKIIIIIAHEKYFHFLSD